MTVYIIRSNCGRYKIGFTEALSPEERMRTLQTGSPQRLTCAAAFVGDVALERTLHRTFDRHRVHGEWFQFSPALGSLIAYANRFGHVEGWAAADHDPELWSDHLTPDGRVQVEKLNQELAHEPRWLAQLERKERLGLDETAHVSPAYWCAGAGPDPVTIRHEDVSMEFVDGAGMDWHHDGRVLGGGGLRLTAECLRRGVDHWFWLSAFVHDLTRNNDGHSWLWDRLYRPEPLVRLIQAHCPSRWHHLSAALPERVWLPERCRVSHEEFIEACGRSARVIASASVVRWYWALGARSNVERRAA